MGNHDFVSHEINANESSDITGRFLVLIWYFIYSKQISKLYFPADTTHYSVYKLKG